jgi:hypothetical protein
VAAFDEVEIQHILSIPDEVRAPIVMALGYPTEWPDPRPRKSLSELVCSEEYVWVCGTSTHERGLVAPRAESNSRDAGLFVLPAPTDLSYSGLTLLL